MFSKTCEYAIKSVIFLYHRDYSNSEWAGLKEIAENTGIPPSFNSKVLQVLAKAGLILSMRGPSGGFRKLRKGDITLSEVVMAIDGPKISKKCILGFEECSTDHPCALHNIFQDIRNDLNKVLDETSINALGNLFASDDIHIKDLS